MKIAPTLRWHIDSKRFGSTMEALRDDSAQMRKELRALIAVARAAKNTLEIIQGTECGCGETTGSGKGLGLNECPMDSEVELERALIRLEKVSKP